MSVDPAQPEAVVIGLSPTGLYAVRELGRAGVPVVGVSAQPQCGNASRYLKASIVEADPHRRCEKLIARYRGSPYRPVLIPCSDQDVEWVMRNSAALSEHCNFQSSYENGQADDFLTKAKFYQICRQHDVPIPESYHVARHALMSLKNDIRYPCLIKPSRIHDVKHAMAGKKGWVADGPETLVRLQRRMPTGDFDLMVQEIVPGPESNITLFCGYFDTNSDPMQSFTARKLRQYPPGFGSASLVVSEHLSETRDTSERFLKALGYRGIAATEFKLDPRDGRMKLIEINPRPSLWFSVSSAAGKTIALAAYHDLASTSGQVADVGQLPGVVWRYGVKDQYSAWFYRLRRGFILPTPDTRAADEANTLIDAVYCSDDPAPASAERWNFVQKMGKRAFEKQTPNG